MTHDHCDARAIDMITSIAYAAINLYCLVTDTQNMCVCAKEHTLNAAAGSRTGDLLIASQTLYQLRHQATHTGMATVFI